MSNLFLDYLDKIDRKIFFVISPLVILNLLVWLSRPFITNGTEIALLLTLTTSVNLVLAKLALKQLPQLSLLLLTATYFFHILFFMLWLSGTFVQIKT